MIDARKELRRALAKMLLAASVVAGLLAAVPATSSAIVYCNQRVAQYSECPSIGVYDYSQANFNAAIYTGRPAINVCQKVRNWADSITVSRRCGSGEIYSYTDVATWVMCQGGNAFNIRWSAGNDSAIRHTIIGEAYRASISCV